MVTLQNLAAFFFQYGERVVVVATPGLTSEVSVQK